MRILTIRDIASQAKVGISTVSRVLNNRPDVKEETRQKVLAVVDACNYTQNSNAKNMRMRQSSTVSIIVRGRDNSFLYNTAEKMLQCAKDQDYQYLIEYIGEKEDEFETARQHLTEKKTQGIIFLGASIIGREEAIAQIKLPLVFATVDASTLAGKRISSIGVDDRKAGQTAIDYLLDRGHSRIAMLGGKREIPDSIGLRYCGVLDSFQNHGLRFDEALYVESGFSMSAAYRATQGLLRSSRPFSAMFCTSDLMAVGAMKAITDEGLAIGRDISVIGFDGIELGRYYTPTLATISQPAEQIAQGSVDLMAASLKDESFCHHVLLNTTLVEGGSAKPCPAAVSSQL
ncbi:MAG: LacI family DNA-binding transcriptional regulator [Clostridia bacterium]